MGLKILIAGCTEPERERVEKLVRMTLGDRVEAGPWSVSLVKLGAQWSITLDGPEPRYRALTLNATEKDLHKTILGAITAKEAPGAATTSAAPAANERRERHECAKCGGGFVVVYRSEGDEPTEPAPVACPHCWEIARVPIAASAAFHQEYRAEPAAD